VLPVSSSIVGKIVIALFGKAIPFDVKGYLGLANSNPLIVVTLY